MTKRERLDDINDRIGLAIGERNLQARGSTAYEEINKIIKDIRKEYQNNVKTRIVIRYDNGHYYGVDTSSKK